MGCVKIEGKHPERPRLNLDEALRSVAASELVFRVGLKKQHTKQKPNQQQQQNVLRVKESKVRRKRKEWREECPKAMGKPEGRGCDPNEGANAVATLLK